MILKYITIAYLIEGSTKPYIIMHITNSFLITGFISDLKARHEAQPLYSFVLGSPDSNTRNN